MARELQRQKEVQKRELEEKQAREANLKWAAKAQQNIPQTTKVKKQPAVKSLLEIQKEEEIQMKKVKLHRYEIKFERLILFLDHNKTLAN